MIIREELPEALTPAHIQQILSIGRKQTYELLEKPPFHIVRVGRLYKISKKSFFEWFDGEQR
jgi:hypothetical protein